MAHLSIVIPALGDIELLEDGLVSVLERRSAGVEIIVVLACRYDDPYDLGEEVRFLPLAPGARWIDCVNAGILASAAPIVHVLAAGSQVCDGWTDAALPHFDDPSVAAVAPLVVAAERPDRVLCAGVDYSSGRSWLVDEGIALAAADRAARHVLGPSRYAAFYRKAALLDTDIMFEAAVGDRLADVDLAIRLASNGHMAVFEPESRVAAPTAAWHAEGAYAEGRYAERLFWRHLGHSHKLHGLALHACDLLGEAATAVVSARALARFAGRVAAWFERPADKADRRIDRAPSRLIDHPAHSTARAHVSPRLGVGTSRDTARVSS